MSTSLSIKTTSSLLKLHFFSLFFVLRRGDWVSHIYFLSICCQDKTRNCGIHWSWLNIKPAVIGWLILTKWLNEVEKQIFNPWFTNPWLNLIRLYNISIVRDEGYSRIMSCALNLISMFLFLSPLLVDNYSSSVSSAQKSVFRHWLLQFINNAIIIKK